MPRAEIARHHLSEAVRRSPQRLRELSARERLLLAQTPILLPVVALALRWLGLGRVQRWLNRRPPRRAGPTGSDRAAEAARLAWIVKISALYGPWPANCLQRSVVLWWYLGRRGLDGDLRIGVRRDRETGKLDFHAWIEHDGVVINDGPDVRQRYATFDRAIAPRQGKFT